MEDSRRHRTLAIVGSPNAPTAELVGRMLFEYGGIDILTMEKLELNARSYDQVSRRMQELDIPPTFYTPRGYHVTLLDHDASGADCTVVLLDPNDIQKSSYEAVLDSALKQGTEVIVVIDNMVEEEFSKMADIVMAALERSGVADARIPTISISVSKGENLVGVSSDCAWYQGWVKRTGGEVRQGRTLLEALDASFEST